MSDTTAPAPDDTPEREQQALTPIGDERPAPKEWAVGQAESVTIRVYSVQKDVAGLTTSTTYSELYAEMQRLYEEGKPLPPPRFALLERKARCHPCG